VIKLVLDARVLIQTFIDAKSVQYREQDKGYQFDIEMATAVYDLTGKRVNLSSNEAHGNLTAERVEVAKRNGYRYVERLALKPGTYQVRVGVLELATERIGTATTWVEVPDLSKGKLTLSAIILTREGGEDQRETKEGKETKDGREPKARRGAESMSPAVTQGIRVYKQGDSLNYDLIIYAGSGKNRKQDEMLMRTEIGQADVELYRSAWSSVASRATARDKKGTQVSGQIKLNNVTPGIYELRVSVKDSRSKKPAERVALFCVEP
jgi:hypothetical protein